MHYLQATQTHVYMWTCNKVIMRRVSIEQLDTASNRSNELNTLAAEAFVVCYTQLLDGIPLRCHPCT